MLGGRGAKARQSRRGSPAPGNRKRDMSDFISRYQEQLHTAARRELRRRRRPRFAGRTLVAVLFVALAGGWVPAAAPNGWFPFAGRTDAPSSAPAAAGNGRH